MKDTKCWNNANQPVKFLSADTNFSAEVSLSCKVISVFNVNLVDQTNEIFED